MLTRRHWRFERVGAKCRGGAQFVQATKFWNGTLRLGIGQTVLLFRFDEGELQSVSEGDDDPFDEPGNFGFDASIKAWNKLLLRSPDSQQLARSRLVGRRRSDRR